MTSSTLDSAISTCEDLIAMVQSATQDQSVLPKMNVDPDDPWASTINPPDCVYKEKCPITGYLLTKPFEGQCPMPEAFKGDKEYLLGMLKPIMGGKDGGESSAGGAKAPAEKTAAGAGGEGSASKKEKKQKAAAPAAPAAGGGAMECFAKCLFKVGLVEEAGFVENSDKLYCCKVKFGEEERQIVTGLRKHVPQDQLQGSKVAVIMNLKTAKLAGLNSEGMILATEYDEGAGVKLLKVPQDSEVGSPIFLEGGEPSTATVKQLKTAVWDTVKAGLRVLGEQGTFDGKKLVCSAGVLTSDVGVPDGALIK
ncbi:hypothetical protein CYMTET_16914 [Cymbomonas tetramitiformis]|uniref:tRNA-binding domain-containing protein n=1 Tax=Cymbomonas tetramitiformis TaxID=36881 RepID=A0AAE0GB89_9CHLO|nr:hypothetical protein CYMTET_16914 [Cymbomonas tetramitiformis]